MGDSAMIARVALRPMPLLRNFHATPRMEKTVALVLAGNGVYDGTEITEAVSTMVHIAKGGANFQCYAPDAPQMHVIDHTKGEPMEEERNVLLESARIARGAVQPLS